MDTAKINKAEEIFHAAVDLPVEERQSFLTQRCAGDAGLRALVEQLLSHDSTGMGEFMRKPVFTPPPDVALHALDSLPQRIGAYEVTGIIGEGGMGTVYLGRQENPKRTVAVKVIKPGLASRSMLKRFEHEAQILGQLQHPGIAHVYEAGTAVVRTGSGASLRLPFFAMEYIEGDPLDKFVRESGLSTRDRLRLFAGVCDAVQHAHQKGVIHRDLKPGNILIDRTRRAKVLDFGVARATDADAQTAAMQTEAGQVVGTLAYMSPEQVKGDSGDLDTRSDVYSLGVILFELLVDRLPFDINGCSLPEAARRICDREPVRLTSINKKIRGEIQVIVARALEKDKTRRYQSASDLAADIRRHLRGEPIEARSDSAFYVLRKTLSRYRGVFAAVALFVLLLAAFGVVSFIQAEKNRRLAADEREAHLAALASRERADREAEKLRQSLYFSHIGYAQAALTGNDIGRVKYLLDECPSDLRNWEWHYLSRISDRSIHTLPEVVDFLHTAVMSRDGRHIVTWQRTSGILTVFDAQARSQLRSFNVGQHCDAVTVGPDGETFVLADLHGTVKVRDLVTGKTVMTMGDDGESVLPLPGLRVRALAFNPDGTIIASGGRDGKLRLWNAGVEEAIRTLEGHQGDIICAAFTPDGRNILTGGADATIRLWDVMSGVQLRVFRGHSLPIHSLAVSLDGSLLASGSNDQNVRLWDMATGQELAILIGHQATIPSVAFSPDGTRLVSGSADHTIKLWNVATYELLDSLLGHVDKVDFVSFTPDGRQIISASREGTLKWWPAAPRPAAPVIECDQAETVGVAFSPDGARMLSSGGDGTTKVWDVETGAELITLSGHTGSAYGAAFSPDGSRIVSGSHDHTVRIWDVHSGREIGAFTGHSAAVYSASFDQTGTRVVSADAAGTVKLWDASDYRELLTLHAHDDVAVAAFSSDGARIATGGRDGLMKVWNANTGAELLNVRSYRHVVYRVTFSPDDSKIVSVGGEPGDVKFWNAETGELLLNCVGHRGAVLGAAFSPDGSRLATAGSDRTLRIWNCATGKEILALRGHEQLVHQVAFSPDGSRIVSSSDDGTIRLWESRTDHRTK